MRLPGRGLSLKELFVALKDEWSRDQITNVAGALTFFAVLAIFPFLVFLISLASVIINPSQTAAVIDQLRQVAPPQVTQILSERIQAITSQPRTGLLTVGFLGAVVSASGGVVSLMDALNTVYGVREGRPFWKVRLLALGMTLFFALLGILATVAVVAIPPLAAHLGGWTATAINILRIPVAGVIVMFLWAVVFYTLPDVEQDFRFITPGSVIGVILWLIASFLFSLYVTHAGSYEAEYGALGGIIVLLLWLWISSITLLLGAEINAVIEHKSPEGKVVGAKRMRDSGVSPTKTEAEERAASKGFPGAAPLAPSAVHEARRMRARGRQARSHDPRPALAMRPAKPPQPAAAPRPPTRPGWPARWRFARSVGRALLGVGLGVALSRARRGPGPRRGPRLPAPQHG